MSHTAPSPIAATREVFSWTKSIIRKPVRRAPAPTLLTISCALPVIASLAWRLRLSGTQPVAQLVDVAAHPLAGGLDLALDLLGCPAVRLGAIRS